MKKIDGVEYRTPEENPDSTDLMNVYAGAIKRVFGADVVVMWGDDETIRVERGDEVWAFQIGSDDDDMYFWRQPEAKGDKPTVVTLNDDEDAKVQIILAGEDHD